MNDFGAGQVLEVNPQTGAATVFMTLPARSPIPAGAGLNDITFDRAGNVYVSDSFQGIVWKTLAERRRGAPSGWTTRCSAPPASLLSGPTVFASTSAETALFVANTGNDTVIKIPVTGGTAGTPAIFANSINGADGLIVDDHDNLWVAANQGDEIVVVDPTGKVIAKLGDFGGAVRHGQPDDLLFPASLRFSGKDLLVTNLALDLRLFNA